MCVCACVRGHECMGMCVLRQIGVGDKEGGREKCGVKEGRRFRLEGWCWG